MIKITRTLLLLNVLPIAMGARAASLNDTAYSCLVRNVRVPRDSITMESSNGSVFYYSGSVFYDLETDLDSVPVHVYMEEVPMRRYRLHDSLHVGHVPFSKIDSLCSGSIGWVSPGSNRHVRWQYGTTATANHCRIKVGVGNVAFVRTHEISKTGSQQFTRLYSYNKMGLLHRIRSWQGDTAAPPRTEQVIKYTEHGQTLGLGRVVNSYDSLGRLCYSRMGTGVTSLYVYGYSYDIHNRLRKRYHLRSGALPCDFSTWINRDSIAYDDKDRIVYKDRYLRIQRGAYNTNKYPLCSGFTFSGLDAQKHVYSGLQQVPDTIRRVHVDTSTGTVMSRNVTVNFHNGSTVDSSLSSSSTHGDPGTCWGSDQNWPQKRIVYTYDQFGRKSGSRHYERLSSDSSWVPTVRSCWPVEYDSSGNITVRYSSCDSSKTEWSAVYNRWNEIIQQKEFGVQDTTLRTYTYRLLDLNEMEDAALE